MQSVLECISQQYLENLVLPKLSWTYLLVEVIAAETRRKKGVIPEKPVLVLVLLVAASQY